MDMSCDFCSKMRSRLPRLGSSKVLLSIILTRFHDVGHADESDLLLGALNLITEAASLRLEVAQGKQLLLAKEISMLDKHAALCVLLTDLGLASFSGSLDSSSGSVSNADGDSDEDSVDLD